MKTKKILISGGEPFVYEKLFDAIRYAKSNNLEVYLSSGGYGATSHFMSELKRSGIDGLYISLNGSSAEINSKSRDGYIDAINAIYLASTEKISTRINWVARKDNYKDFGSLINLAEKMCIDQIDILRNKPDGTRKIRSFLEYGELSALADEIKRYTGPINLAIESCFYELRNLCNIKLSNRILKGCSAGKYSMSIDARGRFAPCSHAGDKYYEWYDSIEHYWTESKNMIEFREGKAKYQACQTCIYAECCEPCKITLLEKCIIGGNKNDVENV